MPSPELAALSADQEFDSEDWLELMGTFSPAGEDAFTETQSDAVLVGYTDASRAIGIIRFFVGYSQCDTTAPWKLHRYPPPVHPRYPWMNSTGVSLKFFSPKGNPDNPNNAGYVEAVEADGLLPYMAKYEKVQITARFSQLPYPVLNDEQLESQPVGFDTEVDRYATIYETAEPNYNMLQADGGASVLYWAETGTGGPTVADQFASPTGTVQIQNAYSIAWYQVPDRYLFGTNYDPPKITAALGRTNSVAFLGFEIGELLFTGARLERYTPPLWSTDPPAIFWKVTYQFTAFKPEKGVVSAYYGWNLQPFRNGKYYLATRDNTGIASGEKFLPSYDFAKLFEHAEKP
jgi:hypothetical protein